MAQADSEDLIDELCGPLVASTSTAIKKKILNWSQPEDVRQRIAIYDALQPASGGTLDFRLTNILRPSEIFIDKNGTTCQISIEDSDNTKLSDFKDGSLGFLYDKTITPRHHIIVVKYGKDATIPELTVGESRALYGKRDTDCILFSGYNRSGAELQLGGGPGDKIFITYTGVQEGLNDIEIRGIIGWDLLAGININIPSGDKRFSFHTYAKRAIFNENGLPDRMDFVGVEKPFIPTAFDSTKGEKFDNPYFNKSGEGPVTYWTIGDVLQYLLLWYFRDQENLVLDFPSTFKLKPKLQNYVSDKFTIPADTFGSDAEVPTDLNVEGMGLWEALQETMAQSHLFDIGGGYDNGGKFKIEFYPKITNRFDGNKIRDDSFNEIQISRGDFGDTYDEEKVVENSTIFCNRENGIVGRVEVHGARIAINTIFSTLVGPKIDLKFSTTKNAFNAAGTDKLTIADFKARLNLYPHNTLNDKGLTGVIYNFSTLTFASLSGLDKIPLTQIQLNEDTKVEIFDSFEIPEILDQIQPSWSERNLDKIDMGVFVADIVNDDANGKWIFLLPVEKSEVVDAYIAPEEHGALKVTEKNADTGSFNTLEDDSKSKLKLESEIREISKFATSEKRNPIPIVVMCSVLTSYRIKGIAEITVAKHGIAFDETVHKTIIIQDDRYKLNLNYKFANYDSTTDNNQVVDNRGTFTEVPDGFIVNRGGSSDANATKPLTAIQKEAEGWLDRLVSIPQNSGEIKLIGVQEGIRPGQFFTEIEGGGRTIPFGSFIQSVRYQLEGFGNDSFKTFISLGNINEPQTGEI